MRAFWRLLAAAGPPALIFCQAALASPWNRANGDLFVASRIDYFQSRSELNNFARIDSDTYAEFGLTDRWMLGGKLIYSTSFDGLAGERHGLKESQLFVQRQLAKGEHSAFAVQVSGAYAGESADAAGNNPNRRGFDGELRALYGRDVMLRPFKVFVAGEAAFRMRTDGNADQARADALIGLEPSKRILLLLEAQSITSLKTSADAGFDTAKGQATAVWRATSNWSVLVGARQDFAVRNISPGRSFFVGVWSQF